jgi:F-type H+-transporting ATPase subunit b
MLEPFSFGHATLLALGPVAISVPTILIEVAIFLAMVWAMEAWVFTPIRRVWAERDRDIQEGLAASQHSREEAERARQEVERILAGARRDAQKRLDEGTSAGSRIRDELVSRAQEEFRRLVDEARTQVGQERERAAAALKDRIVDMALQAALTVTGQSYDQPQVRELAATVVRREGLR